MGVDNEFHTIEHRAELDWVPMWVMVPSTARTVSASWMSGFR